MHADSWALKAKKLGFRSRAVFKLEEILTKTKTVKKNSLVLDIGSAPGGWSELIKALIPIRRTLLKWFICLLTSVGMIGKVLQNQDQIKEWCKRFKVLQRKQLVVMSWT